MTSPALTPPEPSSKRFKMELVHDNYLVGVSGNDGRYPAGSVLLVDEETAVRWYEKGVAEPAPPDAETYGEISRKLKREEFLRRARPVEGTYDAMIRRDAGGNVVGAVDRPLMREMPKPSRGRPRQRDINPDLVGAAINDPDEIRDEDD